MWLEIDECSDVNVSLAEVLNCLKGIEGEIGLWKWAILALHNALQGAMVCHLSGTAQLGALHKDLVKKHLEWHERDRRGEIERDDLGVDEVLGIRQLVIRNPKDYPPKIRLANADELFKRLKSEKKRLEHGAGKVIDVTLDENNSFKKLHDFRNDLAHFTPKGWSIEVSGLPDMFLHILNVLKKIFDDPWPFRHFVESQTAYRDALIAEISNASSALKSKYKNIQEDLDSGSRHYVPRPE
jgi:hypothetical protein